MKPLEGKSALVTGAAAPNGIGRATAVLMAQRGADVVVQDVNSEGGAETAEMVRAPL